MGLTDMIFENRVPTLLFYMCSSMGMMIFNKLVLRAIRLPIAVCIVQMAFTVCALFALPGLRSSLHFGSLRDAWRWGRIVPLLFAIMLVTSMLALKHATMGAVVVVRNIAPLPTLLIEAVSGERVEVDAQTVLALLAAVGGVTLYSRNDIQFSLTGLAWMGANMVACVLERLLQRRMIAVEPIDVSKTGMMLLNNGIGCVLLLPLLAPFGEVPQLPLFLGLDRGALLLLLLSCAVGVSISFSGLAAQRHVTATGMFVLNNSCKFVVIGFGIFVFGEARSRAAVVGCTVAMLSGVWYAHARNQLAAATKAAAAAAADAEALREFAEGRDVAPPPPFQPPRAAHSQRVLQGIAVAALLVVAAQPQSSARAVDPPKKKGGGLFAGWGRSSGS